MTISFFSDKIVVWNSRIKILSSNRCTYEVRVVLEPSEDPVVPEVEHAQPERRAIQFVANVECTKANSSS